MVAAAASAATKSWTGAISNLWSVGGNWNGGVPPAAGDVLVFPFGAANQNLVNDLPAGLTLQSMSFAANGPLSPYSLSGNGIVLSGGLSTAAGSTGSFKFNLPITLSADQTFDDGNSDFANLNLNGFTLTLTGNGTTISGSLSGSGALIVQPTATLFVTGTSTFTGPITLNGTVEMGGGSISNSLTGNIATVDGHGTLANVSLTNSRLLAGNGSFNGFGTGILTTGNLSLQGGSVNLDLSTPTPGTGYDQINVVGTVTLNSPTLNISLPSAIPAAGQSFTIINNDGIDPVLGTFNGLPEGSIYNVAGTYFRISYVGGTGNDVVLKVIAVAEIPALTDVALILFAAAIALVAFRSIASR